MRLQPPTSVEGWFWPLASHSKFVAIVVPWKLVFLKYLESKNMPEATRLGIANGVAGMLSNLVSCVYYVSLDVEPNPAMGHSMLYNIHTVMRSEGIYGIYRGFGLTTLIQSLHQHFGGAHMVQPSIQFGGSVAFSGSVSLFKILQCLIVQIRSLGYRDDIEKKPSSIEMVSVQASAGLVAGALSSVVTTPIDTVKTRLQWLLLAADMWQWLLLAADMVVLT
ncbi:Mitochondrial glycine transporter [Bienertia sinuspersici]